MFPVRGRRRVPRRSPVSGALDVLRAGLLRRGCGRGRGHGASAPRRRDAAAAPAAAPTPGLRRATTQRTQLWLSMVCAVVSFKIHITCKTTISR